MPGAATKIRRSPKIGLKGEEKVFGNPSKQKQSSKSTYSLGDITGLDSQLNEQNIHLATGTLRSFPSPTKHSPANSQLVTPLSPQQSTQALRSQLARSVSPSPQDPGRPHRTGSRDSGLASPETTPDRLHGSKVRLPALSIKRSDSLSSDSQGFFTCPSSPTGLLLSSPPASRKPSGEILGETLQLLTPPLDQTPEPHTPNSNPEHIDLDSKRPNDALLRPALRVVQSPGVEMDDVAATGLLTPLPTPHAQKEGASSPPPLLQLREDRDTSPVPLVKKDVNGSTGYHKSQLPSLQHNVGSNPQQRSRANDGRLCQGKTQSDTPCGNWARKPFKLFQGYCRHHGPKRPDQPGSTSLSSTSDGSTDHCGSDLGIFTAQSGSDRSKSSDKAKIPAGPVVERRQMRSTRRRSSNFVPGIGIDRETAKREYIPSYMTEEAQESFLDRMNEFQDSVDEGYIYVCEVIENKDSEDTSAEPLEPRSEHYIYIKVGCAKRPKRRISQWNGRGGCNVNNFSTHGIWPKYQDTTRDSVAPNTGGYGDPCRYKYFLERLIQFELEYLARTSAHLAQKERTVAPKQEVCPCKPSGVVHKEIYAIARYGVKDGGENDEKLWEMIDEIADRWTQFVALYCKAPRRLSTAS